MVRALVQTYRRDKLQNNKNIGVHFVNWTRVRKNYLRLQIEGCKIEGPFSRLLHSFI